MTKINFTKEHMVRLYDLASEMLFSNSTIQTSMGQVLNIVELLHTTSIGQLQTIMSALKKKIDKLEEGDEWIAKDNDKLDELRRMKELVNLIIGWKRHSMEIAENKRKKEELTKKLAELKESTKTPEDRIKEMEAELAALEEF
jgi:cell division protein FtsB